MRESFKALAHRSDGGRKILKREGERKRRTKRRKRKRKSSHQQQRVQHEPDGIVHRLGFRKRLVPALVGLDPDPRADGPLEPPVAHPGEAAEGGGRGVGCGDPGNPEGGERGERGGEGEVDSERQRRAQQGALEAVLRDGLPESCYREGRGSRGLARRRRASCEGPGGCAGAVGRGGIL